MRKIIARKGEMFMMHHTRSVQFVKSVLAAAALSAVAGCYENHHHSQPTTVVEERTVYQPAPPPREVVVEQRPVVVTSPTWYDDPHYVNKWEVDRRDRHGRADKSVPKVAVEEAIGRGVIAWKSPARTYVWVTDSEHDAVMWSGVVYPGEVVEVVPKHNRIFVGHREVARFEHMKDEIRYRVWSDRGRLHL